MRSGPLLAALQIAAAVAMFPAFFCVVSFLTATSAAQAASAGKPLPSGWTAGVMNHGAYYQWWLIQDRPVIFVLVVVVLVSCLAFLLLSAFRYRGRV